ncbi:MAG: hypothetical protein WAU45_06640 [Blastocatellia bacterium]
MNKKSTMAEIKGPKTRRKSSHNQEVTQAASLRSIKTVQVAVGFRVKSGRAIAVVLAGPSGSPQVLARREISLCDPAVPDSIQPYHAALELPKRKASKVIEGLLKVVQRATQASVKALLNEWRAPGYEVGCAGLVVGSLVDPASIRNDHIRAHALEGQLFRTAVEDALRAKGMSSLAIPERDVYSKGAAALGRSEDELKRAASELGRAVAGSWRADEKTATLAAWMALKSSKG